MLILHIWNDMQQIELINEQLEKMGPVTIAYLMRKLRITYKSAREIIINMEKNLGMLSGKEKIDE